MLGMVLAGVPALAGGGMPGGGSTEITQLMNNAELVKSAADQARVVVTTTQSYYTQLQQFNLQRLAGLALDKLPPGMAADLTLAMSTVQKYQGAVTQLRGSLMQQRSLLEQRITEAQMLGRDPRAWARYTKNVQQDIASGKQSALLRMQQEQAVLKQVQSDYDYARSVQEQIPQMQGEQQSLGLLNAQMNRVVQQNARMLEVMSATVAQYGQNDSRAAQEKAFQKSQADALEAREQEVQRRQRVFGGLQ